MVFFSSSTSVCISKVPVVSHRGPLLTLLIAGFERLRVFHQSSMRAARNGAKFHLSWEYFPREHVTKALRTKKIFLFRLCSSFISSPLLGFQEDG